MFGVYGATGGADGEYGDDGGDPGAAGEGGVSAELPAVGGTPVASNVSVHVMMMRCLMSWFACGYKYIYIFFFV